jgi:hypothetical protein
VLGESRPGHLFVPSTQRSLANNKGVNPLIVMNKYMSSSLDLETKDTMKFVLTLLFLTFRGILARTNIPQRSDPQLVRLTFHGGLASYSMAFPADGNTRKTGRHLC